MSFWNGTSWVDERPSAPPTSPQARRRTLRDWLLTVPIVLLVPVLLYPSLSVGAASASLTVAGVAIPGGQLTVTGEGFPKLAWIELHWDGTFVGSTVRTNSSAALSTTITIPIDTVLGDHRLSALSSEKGGSSNGSSTDNPDPLAVDAALASVTVSVSAGAPSPAPTPVPTPVPGAAASPSPRRSLSGSGNNVTHANWGQAGTQYLRVGPASYADDKGATVYGPNARYISNRIFNDTGQNLFSERGASQWNWVWGQFIDHDIGLRDETNGEDESFTFDATDPLEDFTNDFGVIGFNRTPAAPGTGTTRVRQAINTLSSYIDASQVYGVDSARNDWLRDGASLMLPGGFLPRANAKPNAPAMDFMGQLMAHPEQAVIAGDVRANENLALTAVQTLFAREHNRIVGLLPDSLSETDQFNIARRIVGAEMQFITYTEFLPGLGVSLPSYRGYNPSVNATLSNEFAVVGYRAHSMVHGEFAIDPEALDDDTVADLVAMGAGLEEDEGLIIPLNLAFGNPSLLDTVGMDAFLESLTESQYKNDEQIDNTMRSILFQVPIGDPTACDPGVPDPGCFDGVQDIGSISTMRARDHGIPLYNDLRIAFGLPPKSSFTAMTGEATDELPSGLTIDSPEILDFVSLTDVDGKDVEPGGEGAVIGVRRSTLAARLRAIYGNVWSIGAFVGMVSEKHVPGTEFGELQLAIWKRQFTALRDGDRYFYGNDPVLTSLSSRYGITYRHSLAEIIALNTGNEPPEDVFLTPDEE